MPIKIYIEVESLRHNLLLARGRSKLCFVVKAEAYGHGLLVSTFVEDLVDFFAVATAREGVTLRELGIVKPILVMIFCETEANLIAQYSLSAGVFTEEQIKALLNTNKPISIHIKLNTGMNRVGMSEDEAASFLECLDNSYIAIEGVYSHISSIKDSNNATNKFYQMAKTIDPLHKSIWHIAASSTRANFPCDMIRVGIDAYLNDQQVLSIHSRIIALNDLKVGDHAGYDGVFCAIRPTKLATVVGGYFDGIIRANLGGQVIINSEYANIVAVCMDSIIVDVTNIEDIKIDDNVIIIGGLGNKFISAYDVAKHIGTIAYEVLARSRPRGEYIYLV